MIKHICYNSLGEKCSYDKVSIALGEKINEMVIELFCVSVKPKTGINDKE